MKGRTLDQVLQDLVKNGDEVRTLKIDDIFTIVNDKVLICNKLDKFYVTRRSYGQLLNDVKNNEKDELLSELLSGETTDIGKDILKNALRAGEVTFIDAIFSDIILYTICNSEYEASSPMFEVNLGIREFKNKKQLHDTVIKYVKERMVSEYPNILSLVPICETYNTIFKLDEECMNFINLYRQAANDMYKYANYKEIAGVTNDKGNNNEFIEDMIDFIYHRMPNSLQTDDKTESVKSYLNSLK